MGTQPSPAPTDRGFGDGQESGSRAGRRYRRLSRPQRLATADGSVLLVRSRAPLTGCNPYDAPFLVRYTALFVFVVRAGQMLPLIRPMLIILTGPVLPRCVPRTPTSVMDASPAV